MEEVKIVIDEYGILYAVLPDGENAKYVQMYTVILTMGKSECMVR